MIARQERPSLREQRLEKIDDTATAVDDLREAPFVRLSTVDLKGKNQALTWDRDWIAEMAVSPDGKSAVVSASQSTRYDFDAKIPPKVFLVDLETGQRQEILSDSGLLPHSFTWSHGEEPGFYFIDDFTNHPTYRMATVAHLHFYDLSSGQSRRLEHGWSRGIGADFDAVPGGVVGVHTILISASTALSSSSMAPALLTRLSSLIVSDAATGARDSGAAKLRLS